MTIPELVARIRDGNLRLSRRGAARLIDLHVAGRTKELREALKSIYDSYEQHGGSAYLASIAREALGERE
jgi:hypothetical protein